MSYYPPVLGWEDDGCNPGFSVRWRDGTVLATIPGGILASLDPEWEAEEVAEARREELRNLAENVVLLDDWRK
ncbi:MAG: hypothetical protein WAK55_22050 [Xanthobacteraceae bacterium]